MASFEPSVTVAVGTFTAIIHDHGDHYLLQGLSRTLAVS